MPATSRSPVDTSIVRTDTTRQISNNSPFVVRSEMMRPQSRRDLPSCPSYLGVMGKEIWEAFMDDLENNKFVNTLMVPLEMFIHMYLQWRRVRKCIEREGYIQKIVDRYGNEHSRPHPMQADLNNLQMLLTKQYRTMFYTMANTGAEHNFIHKLEAVAEKVEAESSRGDLIGGDRMAA